MSKQIKSLTVREQCREKISVWFGSKSNHFHAVRESMANCYDEVYNNRDEGSILVTLLKDKVTFKIRDNGRGIPIHLKTDGKHNYELLFETLFAGTKYNNDDEFTTGTNGCGMTVTQYCSDYFMVTSIIKGKKYFVEYENGLGLTNKDLKGIPTDEQDGTEVMFRLSNEVFDRVEFDPEMIKDLCYRIALVSGGHTVVDFKDEVNEQSHTFKFNDISDGLSGDTAKLCTQNLLDKKNNNHKIEFVLCNDLSENNTQDVYLNATHLSEGGTIHDGIYEAIRRFTNKYIEANNLYEGKEKKITKNDVENSIQFICNYFSSVAEYANQTKLSTKSKVYRDMIIDYMLENLEVLEKEDPMFVKKLANNILINKRSNEKVQDMLKETKKKLTQKVNNIDNRVKGFVDCEKHGLDSMLFIAEGLSALGSIVLARNSENQACFPLRGKMLNVLKIDYNKILQNKEIEGLIKVLGCGIQTPKKKLDKSNLRFGSIVCACDQDPDGLHIQCLIITTLYILCPDLIADGHVFVLDTPLYEIRNKQTDEMHYAFSEKEMTEITSKIKNYHVARNKGLGETDTPVMKMCIQKGAKTIRPVTMDEATKVAKYFDIFMGDNLEERKKYIEENLHKYMNLD